MDAVVFSDKLHELLDLDAELAVVGEGFRFTEGPVWDTQRNGLFFSDIPANTIFFWSEAAGLAVFRQPSGQSNGLTLDQQGRLLACEHANRRVSRTVLGDAAGAEGPAAWDGEPEALATAYNGRTLNSPNDIVVKSDGTVYFTDPPYGLKDPDERELPFQGVYRLVPDSGALTLLVDDFEKPNGLCFSPDESLLYIDDTAHQHVRVFAVNPDGSLGGGRVFAELDPKLGPGVPDGMKVDSLGNLYCTGPAGVWVFDPKGQALGVIQVPQTTANLAWGDADGRCLYLTASTSVYRLRTRVQGLFSSRTGA